MLILNSDIDIPPMDEYVAIMRRFTYLLFDYDLFKKDVAECRAIEQNRFIELSRYIAYKSDNLTVPKLTQAALRRFLEEYEKVPEDYFLSYSEYAHCQTASFDDSTRDRITRANLAPEAMELINNWFDIKTKADVGEKFLKGCRNTGELNEFGHKLYDVPFYYEVKKTNRIYAKAEAAVGLPKIFTQDMSIYKDYFLFQFDFSQVDLRVAWNIILRNLNNGEVLTMGDVSDYYENIARQLTNSLNSVEGNEIVEFDIDKFKEERPGYKTGTLAAVYGGSEYTVDKDIHNMDFSRSLHHYINKKNEGYKIYKKSLETCINQKKPFYATGYFGDVMYVDPYNPKAYTSSLNKPIQNTSANLLQFVTVEMCHRMWRHVDESYFMPILNKHDETIIAVHKDCIPHMYEVLDCCKIQVDDWDPLELEWSAGYHYKVPDSLLTNQILATLNSHTLTPAPSILHKRVKPYRPFPIANFIYHTELCHDGVQFSILYDNTLGGKACVRITRNILTINNVWEDLEELYSHELCNINSDRIYLITDNYGDYRTYPMDHDMQKEVILFKSDNAVNNYAAAGILKAIAASYVRKTMQQEPPNDWILNGNINARKGLDIVWKITA